jgi:AraC family transcriptional regulator
MTDTATTKGADSQSNDPGKAAVLRARRGPESEAEEMPQVVAIKRAIEEARKRLDQRMSISDLAAVAFLSPFHFCRVFRRITGVSPARFFRAMRMEAAQQLILESNRSVTDVSLDVGFQSLGTFTTSFSQATGVSPRRLRRLRRLEARQFQVGESTGGRRRVISGELVVEGLRGGLALVGLFADAIPFGKPIACTAAGVPGAFELVVDDVPAGRYNLFVAAIPANEGEVDAFRGFASPAYVGHAAVRIVVDGCRPDLHVDVSLRGRRITDPPVVIPLADLIPARPSPDQNTDRGVAASRAPYGAEDQRPRWLPHS